jgi:hypothetical protein
MRVLADGTIFFYHDKHKHMLWLLLSTGALVCYLLFMILLGFKDVDELSVCLPLLGVILYNFHIVFLQIKPFITLTKDTFILEDSAPLYWADISFASIGRNPRSAAYSDCLFLHINNSEGRYKFEDGARGKDGLLIFGVEIGRLSRDDQSLLKKEIRTRLNKGIKIL